MQYIKAIALRSFPYSEDGITEKSAKAHETFDCPAHLFNGLNDARIVRRAEIGDGHVSLRPAAPAPEAPVVDATETSAPVAQTPSSEPEVVATEASAESSGTAEPREEQLAIEIPEDWKTMKWFALRSLAAKVANDPINDMNGAVAAIEAEIARRAAGE